MKKVVLVCGLKGQDMEAQGAALGKGSPCVRKPCKGDITKEGVAPICIAPFQG